MIMRVGFMKKLLIKTLVLGRWKHFGVGPVYPFQRSFWKQHLFVGYGIS